MKQSVFLQANGLAFQYVSDILKHLVSNCAWSKMKGKIADRYVGCEPEKKVAVLIHRRWNDKETLLQLMMGSTSYTRIQNFSLGSGLE